MKTLIEVIKSIFYGLMAAIILGLVIAIFVFGSVVLIIIGIALAVILIAYWVREMLERDGDIGG
jgi:hypothetical protein